MTNEVLLPAEHDDRLKSAAAAHCSVQNCCFRHETNCFPQFGQVFCLASAKAHVPVVESGAPEPLAYGHRNDARRSKTCRAVPDPGKAAGAHVVRSDAASWRFG
jgi:hypothetical protein